MSQPGPPEPAAAPQPSPMPAVPPPFPVPTAPDSPSPIGLVAAGAGLLLLCVSLLLPRVSIDYEGQEDEYGYFGLSNLTGGGAFSIDTSTVVLIVALLAAVGLSAHHSPGFRWPARLSAVGLAALTAAFAYHPVTALRQFLQTYEDSSTGVDYAADTTPEISVEADNGVYIAVIAVALLAASTFFMRMRQRPYYPVPAAPAAPAGEPGTETTVTVTPG